MCGRYYVDDDTAREIKSVLRVITLVQAWRTTEAELVSLNGCRSVSKEIPFRFLFVLENYV